MTPVAAPARVADALELAREVFAATGAELVDPPVLQPAPLYVDLSGEDVRARLYMVDDPGGANLCLRPDLTVPVARLHLERDPAGAAPAAYRYEGKAFRYAPEDAGRPTEFLQVGVERYNGGPEDDAAVLANCLDAVNRSGARADLIQFADSGLIATAAETFDLPAPAKRRLIHAVARGRTGDIATPSSSLALALAQLSPADAEAALADVAAMAAIEHVGSRPLSAVTERLMDEAAIARAADAIEPARDALKALAAVEGPLPEALSRIEQLSSDHGLQIEDRVAALWGVLEESRAQGVDLAGARFAARPSSAFAYYDGLVFEVRDTRLGAAQVLAAGGRYGRLLERLGAEPGATAAGGMVRPGRLAASAEAGR